MVTALILEAPRALAFVDEPEPALAADQVRVRTLLSGISAGTELTSYRGTSPHVEKRWDAERRLFVRNDAGKPKYPVTNLGYEEVGEIVELGADVHDLAVGDRVCGTWGHRTAHVAAADYVRARRLPRGVDPLVGIFSHMGPVALNGVLDAEIRLGETVCVFGLGVVGQLVAQLARLSGARVIGVDPVGARRDLAARLGATDVLDAGAGSVAEQVKELTRGRGADVCIEASGSTNALNEAIRACAYSSKVVAMGFFQGEGKGLFLGEEFHHNRIDLVCSQISGVANVIRHRWDRLRLISTFIDLAAAGSVDVGALVTHRRPFAEARALFELLDARPAEALQTVLTFDGGAS